MSTRTLSLAVFSSRTSLASSASCCPELDESATLDRTTELDARRRQQQPQVVAAGRCTPLISGCTTPAPRHTQDECVNGCSVLKRPLL